MTDSPVARIAWQLALAHLIERAVEKGVVDDYAAVAHVLGLSRARLSQVTSLMLLAPEIQEAILAGRIRTAARHLRAAITEPNWESQTIAIANPDEINQNQRTWG